MCDNTVIQMIPTKWHFKEVKMQCGNTSIHGGTLLCEECISKAERNYPQGWRDVPGDTCEHGTYVGTPGGPDYICGECEDYSGHDPAYHTK